MQAWDEYTGRAGFNVPFDYSRYVNGGFLVFTPGIVVWSDVWPWTKLVAVLGMTWFHHWLMVRRKGFLNGTNQLTGRHYRMMNEVPTVFMLIIVFSVIVKF